MPAALEVDWDKIREAYLSGAPSRDIVTKYGVTPDALRQRAKRFQWKPSRRVAKSAADRQVKALVREQVQAALPIVKSAVNDAVSRWTADAHNHASSGMSHVGRILKTELIDPEILLKTASALDKFDTIGRRALGLDREQNDGTDRPNLVVTGPTQIIMNSAVPALPEENMPVKASSEQVIDVGGNDDASSGGNMPDQA